MYIQCTSIAWNFCLNKVYYKYFDVSTHFPYLQLEDTSDIPTEVKENLLPYLFEAGIDVDRLSDKKLVIQDLMLYHVIEKRRRELDDIATGLLCSTLTSLHLHCFNYDIG